MGYTWEIMDEHWKLFIFTDLLDSYFPVVTFYMGYSLPGVMDTLAFHKKTWSDAENQCYGCVIFSKSPISNIITISILICQSNLVRHLVCSCSFCLLIFISGLCCFQYRDALSSDASNSVWSQIYGKNCSDDHGHIANSHDQDYSGHKYTFKGVLSWQQLSLK